ncbi:hypothetical protein R4Z09_17970 [Niallia oryzisoli]|uniref:Uncharacterized protein n=1 Tax=Niallia oryzisoli TaxID=1737571 RepID=A0ABZ2CBH9_9BACI
MEINGPERRSLAQNMTLEDFFIHVATDIERQLKEWDIDYEVMVMKLEDYEFIVKYHEAYCEISFSENIIKTLQRKDPYEIDRKIWKELQNKGISIVKGKGNYIDFIMW